MMNDAERRELERLLSELRLRSFLDHHKDMLALAKRSDWDGDRFLLELARQEARDRLDRRVERILSSSKLPRDKTLGSLQIERFPDVVRQRIRELCQGEFVNDSVNVCLFGPPGAGKTHVMAAIARELALRGVTVLFGRVQTVVERLLNAKRSLELQRELERLDRYHCLCLDDNGYAQHDERELEVLFELLAERYERRSVMITSNVVFSEWDAIFRNPMTAAAAIDRVVHHSIILELNVPSFRTEQARREEPEQETEKRIQ